MNNFSTLGKWGIITLILIVGSIGYLLKTQQQPVQNNPSPEVLVEVSYTGGLMDPEDEKNATATIRIYNNGEVIKETRGGETLDIASVSQKEMENLITLMNTQEKNKAFTNKERHFCDSYVDGVDTEITLSAPGEKDESFSDCDYTFNNQSALLTTIKEMTSPDVQEE